MYLRTGEGFAQNQESWFAPQALNRVMVRSGPIGSLGNFHQYLGDPSKQTCYAVENFKLCSWKLTRIIQSYLDKIAKTIVRTIERKLRKLRLKRGQWATVGLHIMYRGYTDGLTETGSKLLDSHRAVTVRKDLEKRIKEKLETQNLHELFNFIDIIFHGESAEGSSYHSNPGKNRRVEVCIGRFNVNKDKKSAT